MTTRCSQCGQSRKTTTVVPQNLKQNRSQSARQMYLWWSLCSLCLLACQVRVSIGDSGLCCCVCVTSFERLFSPLCVDSLGKSAALDEKTYMKRNQTEARLLNDQPNSALRYAIPSHTGVSGVLSNIKWLTILRYTVVQTSDSNNEQCSISRAAFKRLQDTPTRSPFKWRGAHSDQMGKERENGQPLETAHSPDTLAVAIRTF